MSNLSFDQLKDVIKRYQKHNNAEDADVLYNTFINVLVACKYVLEKNTSYKAPLNTCVVGFLDVVNKLNIDKFSSMVKFKAYIYKTVYWRIFEEFRNNYDVSLFEFPILDGRATLSTDDVYGNHDYGVVFSDVVRDHKHFHYFRRIAIMITQGYNVNDIIKELRITKNKYQKLIKELKRL